MAGGLQDDSGAGTTAELGEIIARLQALTSEPPTTAGVAKELQAIREYLGQLAADNAEVGRLLGQLRGAHNSPDLPQH